MVKDRLDLHEEFCGILGNRHVYFQPPEGKKIYYPCIIYEVNNVNTNFADDKPYLLRRQYVATLIYEDPDSPLTDKLAMHFETIRHNRHFTADNLNHDVYELYW